MPQSSDSRLSRLLRLAPAAGSVLLDGNGRGAGRQAEIERRLFAGLRLRNGVFKSTAAGRLAPLDALVEPLLPADRPLELMDVAASSGVTTADWVASLRAAGIAHRMTASDLCVEGLLVGRAGRLAALVDRTGYPLQVDLLGAGLRTSSGRRLVDAPLAVARSVIAALVRRHPGFRRLTERPAGPVPWSGAAAPPARRATVRPLPLVSRRLAGGGVALWEEDLLDPPPPPLRRRFHAVRAANILNRSYFPDSELVRIAGHLVARLRPRGLLIVGQTEDDGTNHATVFRLDAGAGLEAVAELGGGAPVRELVLAAGASEAGG